MSFAGVVIMETNEYLKRLMAIHHIIGNDIATNPSFTEEDLIEARDSIGNLITQLEFWTQQDNAERFAYEIKCHIKWLYKRFK